MSLSTIEVEYRALIDGAKETINLKRLLAELGFLDTTQVSINSSNMTIISDLSAASTPIVMDMHLKSRLKYDNMEAIKLSHNLVFHSRSKHIKIQHYFVRERILEGEIKVSYIPIANQQVDLLTKSLPRS